VAVAEQGEGVGAVADAGLGADVVSGGELEKALRAGIAPDKIVFSGVGKRDDELRAALAARIRSLNVESLDELDEIAALARELRTVAPVTVRLNPGVAGGTHEYLTTGTAESKFGVSRGDALKAVERVAIAAVHALGLTQGAAEIQLGIGRQGVGVLDVEAGALREPLAEAASSRTPVAVRFVGGEPARALEALNVVRVGSWRSGGYVVAEGATNLEALENAEAARRLVEEGP
jgi:diaminopimelate decarboxylase